MKAALKGVVLDAERLNVPFTITEVEKKTVRPPIAARRRVGDGQLTWLTGLCAQAEGARPPTSIANLIFTFISSSGVCAAIRTGTGLSTIRRSGLRALPSDDRQQLSQTHFPDGIEPLDLFLPAQGISSAQRARAFLFLVWHYYEGPSSPMSENPFADDHSRANPGQVPRLDRDAVQEGDENVDDPDEVQFGQDMQLDRLNHLDVLQREADEIKRQVASGERAPTTSECMHNRDPLQQR